MWGRLLQLLVACWIAGSPMILGDRNDGRFAGLHFLACGAAVAFFAALSFHPRCRYAHLGTVVPAAWMLVVAYFVVPYPLPVLHQSAIVAALLLLVLALVPTHASTPPPSWVAFNARYRGKEG